MNTSVQDVPAANSEGKQRLGGERIRNEIRVAREASLVRFRIANLLCRIMPPFSLSTARAALYRRAGLRIAPRVAFVSGITLIGSGRGVYARLSIGEGSLIGLNPTFNLDDTIDIGRNVSIGPSVSIYTSTHLLGPGSRRMAPGVLTRPVRIEDGAWVGVGTIVLPGVTIGRGAVIGAGSVVSESIPANALASGNPAKVVQELPWPED